MKKKVAVTGVGVGIGDGIDKLSLVFRSATDQSTEMGEGKKDKKEEVGWSATGRCLCPSV